MNNDIFKKLGVKTKPINFNRPKSKPINFNNLISTKPGASIAMQNKWKNMPTIQRNKMRSMFKDSDGDRVPNRFDCQPFNVMRQDTTNLYTWQNPDEEAMKNAKPAEDSTIDRMTPGRSTGWTGTGIYGYRSKEKALVDGDFMRKEGRKLYSVKVNKPLVFDKGVDYDNFMDASKAHRQLTEQDFTNQTEYLGDTLKKYKNAGIMTNEKQLRNTFESSQRNRMLPSTLLLKEKGFDSVIADQSNDTYRTGSVAFGKTGDFRDRLEVNNPENLTEFEKDKYDWDMQSRYKFNKDKHGIARIHVGSDIYRQQMNMRPKDEDGYDEYMSDRERRELREKASKLAHLDKYKNPQVRKELHIAANPPRESYSDELEELRQRILNDTY